MARVTIFKSPDELTGEARRIAEKIVDTRKSLDGPFSVWMHAPEWADPGIAAAYEGVRTLVLGSLTRGRSR